MTEQIKDRGYAWVILVATFFAQAGSIGFSIGGIGLSINSFQESFPNSTIGERAMIGSLRISTQFLSSLLVVPLAFKLGFRTVAVGGTILAAAGIAASIAATELWHAHILFGVIAGFGICCPYATTMTLLGQYFDRLKHIAFPVVALGQAVGTLAFPPVVAEVHGTYRHSGMLIFMASSLLICLVCSMLLKSNDGRSLAQSFTCRRTPAAVGGGSGSDDTKRLSPGGNGELPEQSAPATASPVADELPLTKKAMEAQQEERKLVVNDIPNKAAAVPPARSRFAVLDSLLALLRRWQVCLLIVNSLLWGCCTSGTQALLPTLALKHDVTMEKVALGVTMNGVGMLLASIIMTATGKRTYDRHLLYMLSCGLYGVPPLLLPLIGVQAATYIALFAVSGFWLATLLALCNSVLFDMSSSPDEFGKLLSIYFFANGVGCFIGPTAVGSVSDSVATVANAGVVPALEWPAWALCGCFGFASTLVFIPTYVSNLRRAAAKELSSKAAVAADPVDDTEAAAAMLVAANGTS